MARIGGRCSGIRVEVPDGEITLEGTVSSRREKHLAEDALYAVSGVRDVYNRLRVAGSGARRVKEEP